MKLISTFLLLMLSALYCQAQPGAYHLYKTFPVEGDGKWDYLAINPVTNNLYISHGTQVNVVDREGQPVRVIPNTTGVHGIAFAPDQAKGFISNGKLNTVTVFDINNDTVMAQIQTGENPDAIMLENFTGNIFVCNGRSSSISIINPKNNSVVGTIPVGGKPETAVSDDAGSVYVNLEDKNEVVKINVMADTIVARWPLVKGDGPTGLAIDKRAKRLFVGCEKLLVVMNANNGKIVANIPIGDGCDGVAFDQMGMEIYTSNGEGTMSVIREVNIDKYEALKSVTTEKGAKTLVLDEKNKMIYLPTSAYKAAAPPDAKGKPGKAEMIPGTLHVIALSKQ